MGVVCCISCVENVFGMLLWPISVKSSLSLWLVRLRFGHWFFRSVVWYHVWVW